jgi:hypothetical protein
MSPATKAAMLYELAAWARARRFRPKKGDLCTPSDLHLFAKDCSAQARALEAE